VRRCPCRNQASIPLALPRAQRPSAWPRQPSRCRCLEAPGLFQGIPAESTQHSSPAPQAGPRPPGLRRWPKGSPDDGPWGAPPRALRGAGLLGTPAPSSPRAPFGPLAPFPSLPGGPPGPGPLASDHPPLARDRFRECGMPDRTAPHDSQTIFRRPQVGAMPPRPVGGLNQGPGRGRLRRGCQRSAGRPRRGGVGAPWGQAAGIAPLPAAPRGAQGPPGQGTPRGLRAAGQSPGQRRQDGAKALGDGMDPSDPSGAFASLSPTQPIVAPSMAISGQRGVDR
jgi:hypothetical protein